ncbi:hypothetical protein PG993_013161 [Apiospora rasikravindrae]|uniref:Heterokaryon incompatibility domain-containing protein n=1 Tax=Apiospora rasikravindrae TaxID=990691 RepID=A0ABR1RWV0_9PEZI
MRIQSLFVLLPLMGLTSASPAPGTGLSSPSSPLLEARQKGTCKCPEDDGDFPNPCHCAQYLRCTYGAAEIRTCNSGQSVKYVYTTIPQGEYIRLLELTPGETSDGISVSLQIVPLRNCAPYTALSYVWGVSNTSVSIICNGQSLTIQSSLHSALRALRDSSAAKLVWADAICINQGGDVREKNHQVALMGKIYSLATEVIIWLGSDEEDIAGGAFDLAKQIATHNYPRLRRKQPEIPSRGQISNDLQWFALVEYAAPEVLLHLSPIERGLWRNLSRIYRSPWFTRVWVIQEAGLATHATVLCGTRTISWQQLADAAGCIDDRAPAFVEHFDMTGGLEKCVDLYWLFSPSGRRRTFVETLVEAKCFNATNQLDKVYALLSHPSAVTTSGALFMDPDYGLSHDEMCARIAMDILRGCNSLQLLSAVDHNDSQSVDDDLLPSFAPRWHEPPAANMLWAEIRCKTFKASLGYPARYRVFERRRFLAVTGIQVDIVSAIGSQIDKHMWRGEGPERREPLESLAGLTASREDVTSDRYPPGQRRTEAFLMTMTCGIFMGETADFEAYARGCGFRLAHSPASQQVVPEPPRQQAVAGDEGRFIKAGEVWSSHRKPFVTGQGYIGLGSKAMQEDDIVCVVFGCMVPFIFRKSSDSRYRLVGECYVHGIMKGEIPEAWEAGRMAEEEFVIH